MWPISHPCPSPQTPVELLRRNGLAPLEHRAGADTPEMLMLGQQAFKPEMLMRGQQAFIPEWLIMLVTGDLWHARTLARTHTGMHAHWHARTLARTHARTHTHTGPVMLQSLLRFPFKLSVSCPSQKPNLELRQASMFKFNVALRPQRP